MSKSSRTKERILGRAVELTSLSGLRQLTIGKLSSEVRLSKSGLYAHFDSKESLQIEVLEKASQLFLEEVVRPSLRRSRGLARVQGLFDGWLNWSSAGQLPGGCLFVAATSEWDDEKGPVRDKIVQIQLGWLDVLTRAFSLAQAEGQLQVEHDAEQLAFELHGIMLSFHHQARLLHDTEALARAHRAFADLIAKARGESQGVRYQELLRQIDAHGVFS